MTPPAGPEQANDPLAAALADFQEAWYAGRAPDPETFCNRHEKCGPELRRRIDNFLLVVEELDAFNSPDIEIPFAVDAPEGASFGPYRLARELGRGGQGIVYLAEDTRLSRRVALKILSNPFLMDPHRVARFHREARAAGKLGHPGLCKVHESGEVEDVPFIAMQYIRGESLARIIDSAKNRPAQKEPIFIALVRELMGGGSRVKAVTAEFALSWIAGFFEKIARALQAAHAAGVLHRDLKPGNLMVTREGEPVVLDFGLARDEQSDAPTLTGSREVFGTPAYMAPEQIESGDGRPDNRVDLYSLGATLHECLTGKPPFTAATREMLYRKILHEEPGDARRIEPAISRDLAAILETVLAKERGERYPQALDLAEDLRRARQGIPILARPAGPILRLRRWVRRNRLLAGLLATLGLLLSIALMVTGVLLGEALSLRQENQVQSDRVLIPYLEQVEARADWPALPDFVSEMDDWIAETEALLARARDLEPEVVAGLTRRFEKIRARREQAASLYSRSIEAHRRTWEETLAAIADQTANPIYGGLKITPQLGLVPVGQDPDSGLFEFSHLLTGEIARRHAGTGRLKIEEDTGIVLVLLPGATYKPGCIEIPEDQRERVSSLVANTYYDRPVCRLEPYFISKYEMTQGQWLFAAGENPSRFFPGADVADPVTLTHPVETITWLDCDRLMKRLGLLIPTDVQWEYAARGNTRTVWWTGNEVELFRQAVNLTERVGQSDWPAWDDGYPFTAAVGRFPPNPFGLHEVFGNLREWVREKKSKAIYNEASRAGDGEITVLQPWEPERYLVRGGGWDDSPYEALSVLYGYGFKKQAQNSSLGLRPARGLDRGVAEPDDVTVGRDP